MVFFIICEQLLLISGSPSHNYINHGTLTLIWHPGHRVRYFAYALLPQSDLHSCKLFQKSYLRTVTT
jgi:hypothetical protein